MIRNILMIVHSLLALACLGCLVWFRSIGESETMALIPFLLITVIILGLWQKTRWLILPIALFLILMTIVLTALFLGNPGLPEDTMTRVIMGYLVLAVIELCTMGYTIRTFGRRGLPD